METKYYFKELGEQTAIYLSNGTPFKFDWLSTTDAWLIQELNAAIQNGIGGVVSITKAQYDEGVKKKQGAKFHTGSPQYRQELQSLNLSNMQQRGSPVAGRAAGGVVSRAVSQSEMPDPLQVPDPSKFKRPSIGKMP